MSNQTASNQGNMRHRLSTLSFAWAFVLVASVVVAFIQPVGAVNALDEPSEPVVEPVQTTLVFTSKPTEKTNLTNLSWQWQLTVAEDDTATYTGFAYSLKTADGTVVDEGTGDATLLTYSKADALSGTTYTLTVTATTDPEPATPEENLVIASSVQVNTVPPVVTDNGPTWSGSTVTPGLEVKPGQQPPVVPTQPVNPVEPETPVTETPDEGTVTPPAPIDPPAPTYTYSWITDARAGLVTISDSSLLNPQIKFLADGRANFTVRITDEFGNFIDYMLNLSYIAPFIPGPSVPLIPDYTPPELTPTVAVVKIPALSRSVYIDRATTSEAQSAATNVSEEKASVDAEAQTNSIVAATPAQGWIILGLAWYWWVLIVGIVGSAILWYRSYRQYGADDL